MITTSDNVWLINDALFDRYYLSGIAPEFDYSGMPEDAYNDTRHHESHLGRFLRGHREPAMKMPKRTRALEPYIPE